MNNDLISREALKKHAIWTKVNNGVELIDIEVVPLVAIDNAPSVDERPQGEWIKDNSGNRFCSECGSCALYHEIGLKFESRFCPNCGAKMNGGADND